MTWNFACRRCGHRDYYGGYPFKGSGEFPRCQQCGGETYRPSLEDDLLDMDEAHDTQDCYGSAWARAVVEQREEEAAHRGIGDIPDSERGDR
jgi:hypothetical protein